MTTHSGVSLSGNVPASLHTYHTFVYDTKYCSQSREPEPTFIPFFYFSLSILDPFSVLHYFSSFLTHSDFCRPLPQFCRPRRSSILSTGKTDCASGPLKDRSVFWLWGWDWRLTELRPLLRAYCSTKDNNERVKETFSFNFQKRGAHGGIILAGENWRTRRKSCPSATLSTTNPTVWNRARAKAAAVRVRRLTTWAIKDRLVKGITVSDMYRPYPLQFSLFNTIFAPHFYFKRKHRLMVLASLCVSTTPKCFLNNRAYALCVIIQSHAAWLRLYCIQR
jgi:hypothetical protein